MKKKVLFICVQNSARSQIAAALLNRMCGDYFEAHNAGLEPSVLNPLAVEALQDLGIDISGNKTQSVFDVWKSARHIFAYVITVCSESEAESCPIFAGVTKRDCTGHFGTLASLPELMTNALPKLGACSIRFMQRSTSFAENTVCRQLICNCLTTFCARLRGVAESIFRGKTSATPFARRFAELRSFTAESLRALE